ncbi:MAG: protein kinase, partial [Sporichthyaceae bacterium]
MDTTLQDPLVGRVLDGRYHVESRLARGGMATVYLALDRRLDRTIAVKVMHPQLAEDEEFVSRFIREAKSAARLSHPNVVAVYDQGADDGAVFLAMEHVAGRTLRDLMREKGRLSPRQTLEIMESVLAALGAAHHAGIVHRDVKPENVLLADDGRIKVADFGLARAVSGGTNHTSATGVLMGTVAYLSPEQVERGVADPRSDVYAAGILMFEMLTGAKPYDGETAIQVAYRHVHDDVPAPSSMVPGLPSG